MSPLATTRQRSLSSEFGQMESDEEEGDCWVPITDDDNDSVNSETASRKDGNDDDKGNKSELLVQNKSLDEEEVEQDEEDGMSDNFEERLVPKQQQEVVNSSSVTARIGVFLYHVMIFLVSCLCYLFNHDNRKRFVESLSGSTLNDTQSNEELPLHQEMSIGNDHGKQS